MQLFYNPTLNETSRNIIFDKEESRHIVKVLRKKESDILYITNGKEQLFYSRITFANDKKCEAEIIETHYKPKPWNYHLHIAIAPTKNNDRFEWFLEKATEIGIDEITPIICQNSERKVVKTDRFEKIIQSAVKQSLKFTIPKLNSPISFSDFLLEPMDGKICIAHCEDDEKKQLQSTIISSKKITILIGPEGDFSPSEIKEALSKKCIPISLGESRLRTETAGIVAVHTVSIINQ